MDISDLENDATLFTRNYHIICKGSQIRYCGLFCSGAAKLPKVKVEGLKNNLKFYYACAGVCAVTFFTFFFGPPTLSPADTHQFI